MSEDKTTPAKAEGAPAARTELYRQAEQHLQSAGLRILDRDWRCPAGRLPIVRRRPQGSLSYATSGCAPASDAGTWPGR